MNSVLISSYIKIESPFLDDLIILWGFFYPVCWNWHIKIVFLVYTFPLSDLFSCWKLLVTENYLSYIIPQILHFAECIPAVLPYMFLCPLCFLWTGSLTNMLDQFWFFQQEYFIGILVASHFKY